MNNHHKYRWTAIIAALVIPAVFLILLYFSTATTPASVRPQVKPHHELEVRVEIEEAKPVKVIKPEKPAVAQPPSKSEVNKTEKIPDDALPPVSANYRKYLGFKRYVEKMTELGARFFIIGSSGKKMLEIDFNNEKLVPATLRSLKNGGFSPRSRSIADEPALSSYLTTATSQYQLDTPEVFMLVPAEFDRNIANVLRKNSLPEYCSALKGYYQTDSNDQIILALNEAICRNGIKKINITINL